MRTVVVIKHHKKQERKRLSANHKIAKMTTSNIKTFNNESRNEPVRIIVGYTDDQKGNDIRDEDVVRVSNGKWIAQHSTETGSWKEKSTGDAQPTEPAASASRRDLLERSAFAVMGNIKSSFIECISSTPSRFPNYLRKNSKSPRLIACKTGS
jgi:hypothetical protein